MIDRREVEASGGAGADWLAHREGFDARKMAEASLVTDAVSKNATLGSRDTLFNSSHTHCFPPVLCLKRWRFQLLRGIFVTVLPDLYPVYYV